MELTVAEIPPAAAGGGVKKGKFDPAPATQERKNGCREKRKAKIECTAVLVCFGGRGGGFLGMVEAETQSECFSI